MANVAASIAVRIGADLAPLQQGLAKGSDSVAKFTAQSRRELRKAINDYAKVGAAAAAAAAVVGGTMVKASMDAARELKIMSDVANTSTSEFQKWAYGAKAVGVEQDKLADILKDMNDRVGDFINTGGGPMADFFETIAPRVGVTAEQFRHLSGPQALQLFVSSLEKANLAQSEMTFYMEAIASDSTRLLPLLRENGKAMSEQAREAERLGIVLSDVDAEKLDQAGRAVERMGFMMGNLRNQIAAGVAPLIVAMGNEFSDAAGQAGGFDQVAITAVENLLGGMGAVLDTMEGARRTFEVTGKSLAVGFMYAEGAAWRLVDAIINGPVRSTNRLIQDLNRIPGVELPPIGATEFGADVHEKLLFITDAIEQGQADIHETLMEPLPSQAFDDFVARAKAASDEAVQATLKAREAAAQNSVGNVATMGDSRTPQEREQIQKRLEAIRQANLTEIELLKEKQAEEMALIAEGRKLGLESKVSYDELEREAEARHQEEMAEAKRRLAEQTGRWEDMNTTQRLNTLKGYFGQASSLMNSESRKMFEIGKAAAYGTALINTYQGISEAWKLGPILGPPMAALVALNGFAQVQNIRKQKFGGGASSPTGSVTGQINAGNTPVQSTQEQQRNLYVTLQGINPNSFIQAGSLVSALNEELENGGRIRGMGFAA